MRSRTESQQPETARSVDTPRHRLGFPVRLLGDPRLRSHDGRRWANQPHLSVSLLYLRDILVYLQRRNIRVYRLADALAPYLTHPQLPQFHRQIEECAEELSLLGAQARSAGLRLSMHLRSHISLTTPDQDVAVRSLAEIEAQASLLDALELDSQAVLVMHMGGRYGPAAQMLQRAAGRLLSLSPRALARVAVEHDRRFSLNDLLHLHALSGTPIIFDHLHHQLYNPQRLGELEALGYALQTWPAGRRPKLHFSSPRTELRIVLRPADAGGRAGRALEAPTANEHSDYIHPFEFIRFLRTATALGAFDIMLEAKACDLALLRLREDLQQFAPDLTGALS